MKTVKVFLTDGDSYITDINGTDKEIKEYFKIGKIVNIGAGEKDKITRIKRIKIYKN